MTTKLTLTIEETTIQKAKVLSRKRGTSISKMVEDYLNLITEKDSEGKSVVDKMSGLLKNKLPAGTDWKKIKADHLKKKYA